MLLELIQHPHLPALAGAGAILGLFVRYMRHLNRPVSAAPGTPIWIYVSVGAAGGIILFLLSAQLEWTGPSWDYIIVAGLGGAVGTGELASRYRDEPIKAILSVPATIYVLLNSSAAILALILGRHFGFFENPHGASAAHPIAWEQVLSAGFGAMVILRSSIFQIRMSNKQDIGVGPSTFLQSVIDAADRAVDRLRAQERAWTVARVMEGVSCDKAIRLLPSYISALMQNLNPADQSKFDEQVKQLKSDSGSDNINAFVIGLIAMNYTGEGVLRAAVGSLAAKLKDAAEAADEVSDIAKKAVQQASNSTATVMNIVQKSERLASETKRGSDASPEVMRVANDINMDATKAAVAADKTLERVREVEEAAENTAEIANSALKKVNGAKLVEHTLS